MKDQEHEIPLPMQNKSVNLSRSKIIASTRYDSRDKREAADPAPDGQPGAAARRHPVRPRRENKLSGDATALGQRDRNLNPRPLGLAAHRTQKAAHHSDGQHCDGQVRPGRPFLRQRAARGYRCAQERVRGECGQQQCHDETQQYGSGRRNRSEVPGAKTSPGATPTDRHKVRHRHTSGNKRQARQRHHRTPTTVLELSASLTNVAEPSPGARNNEPQATCAQSLTDPRTVDQRQTTTSS